jgi:hypothetical protein
MKTPRRYARNLVAALPLVVPSVVAAVASLATAVEVRRRSDAPTSSDSTTDLTPSDEYTSASNGQTAPKKRSGKKVRATA